jgi:integrase
MLTPKTPSKTNTVANLTRYLGVKMAINIRCPDCKKTFKLGTDVCPCGVNLRTKGKYKVRVKLRSGRWLTRQVNSLNKAKKVEGKFISDSVDEDVFDKRIAPNIDFAWQRYLRWAQSNKRSWDKDKQRWEKFIKPTIGGKRMDRITTSQIQTIIDKMLEGKKADGAPYAPATVKQALVLAKRVFNWSKKQGLYHGDNPCNGIELERFDNQVTEVLSPDELKRLLAVLDADANERATLIVRFGLLTGRRAGEILSLRFDDIDYDGSMAVFRAESAKNKRSQVVLMGQSAMSVLERCREIRISDLCFPCKTGKYYHSFRRTWMRIREQAGLPKLRFHGLRHNYASQLASSGKVDIYSIQRLLGHKTVSTTQRYAHLVSEALRRSTNVANDIFKSASFKN